MRSMRAKKQPSSLAHCWNAHMLLICCLISIWTPGLVDASPVSNDRASPAPIENAVVKDLVNATVTSASTTQSTISSFYVGSLTLSSPVFFRPNQTDGPYYYQAIRVNVFVSGIYTFISNSSADTFGYLYVNSVDPSYPNLNLIAYNDDSGGGNQFRIDQYLNYGTPYFLIVTTFAVNIRANFGVLVFGPSSVSLTSFTPTTSPTSTMTTTRIVPTTSSSATYADSLSSFSPVFYRNPQTDGLYYYAALRVSINRAGTYTFTSTSSFDIYGYLYNEPMDPSIPGRNIIAYNDDSGGGQEFRIDANLQSVSTYVLIVTSYRVSTVGRFSIRAIGPDSIYLTPFVPSTSRPIQTTTTTTTLSPSIYSSSLYSSSPIFYRPSQSDGYYYYEAFQITVYTSGYYTFTSRSSMDTFGLLYNGVVDPSYPNQNLISSDDDSGGNRQFRVSASLQSGTTYVLVVTTFAPNTWGSYSLQMTGPASVFIYPFRPSTSRPIRSTTSRYQSGTSLTSAGIAGIVTGSIVLVAIIYSVCAYSSKQRAVNSRRVNMVAHPMRPVGPNVIRPNARPGPYTIPMQSAYVHSVEEAPPSYDQVAAYLKQQQ